MVSSRPCLKTPNAGESLVVAPLTSECVPGVDLWENKQSKLLSHPRNEKAQDQKPRSQDNQGNLILTSTNWATELSSSVPEHRREVTTTEHVRQLQFKL